MILLEAEKIVEFWVTCENSIDVKDDGSGYLRVIPIIGGKAIGKFNGVIVSAGADWNTEKPNEIAYVFAKYLIKTEDDEYIAIENEGKLSKDSINGKIKTVPTFQADKNGKYSWLNSGVFVGELNAGTNVNEVHIVIYKLM